MNSATLTIAEAIDKHGIGVLDHLDTSLSIPVLPGIQFQGDIAVVPVKGAESKVPLPAKGVPVVRGENGGNTHSLHGDGDVRFDPRDADVRNLSLGRLTVGENSTAYLAHPEHAYSGIAPGTYDIRRQREQAEELRMVTD
jgi:hypothetical protein